MLIARHLCSINKIIEKFGSLIKCELGKNLKKALAKKEMIICFNWLLAFAEHPNEPNPDRKRSIVD